MPRLMWALCGLATRPEVADEMFAHNDAASGSYALLRRVSRRTGRQTVATASSDHVIFVVALRCARAREKRKQRPVALGPRRSASFGAGPARAGRVAHRLVRLVRGEAER